MLYTSELITLIIRMGKENIASSVLSTKVLIEYFLCLAYCSKAHTRKVQRTSGSKNFGTICEQEYFIEQYID